MRSKSDNRIVLSEVSRDIYIGKEANERKKERQEKDLQEVVRPTSTGGMILNG